VISFHTLLIFPARTVFELNQGRNAAFTFAAFQLTELVGVIFGTKGVVSSMTFDPTCHATVLVSKDAFVFL
jgi:hypothetical protein